MENYLRRRNETEMVCFYSSKRKLHSILYWLFYCLIRCTRCTVYLGAEIPTRPLLESIGVRNDTGREKLRDCESGVNAGWFDWVILLQRNGLFFIYKIENMTKSVCDISICTQCMLMVAIKYCTVQNTVSTNTKRVAIFGNFSASKRKLSPKRCTLSALTVV